MPLCSDLKPLEFEAYNEDSWAPGPAQHAFSKIRSTQNVGLKATFCIAYMAQLYVVYISSPIVKHRQNLTLVNLMKLIGHNSFLQLHSLTIHFSTGMSNLDKHFFRELSTKQQIPRVAVTFFTLCAKSMLAHRSAIHTLASCVWNRVQLRME